MTINYSESLHNVLLYSAQEAERLGNNFIGPEHLLLGLLRNGNGKAIEILNQTHINLLKVKQIIESQIRTDLEPTGAELPVLKSAERIKKIMELEARSLMNDTADTEHLLLAILKENNGFLPLHDG
ncbi:MAG: Clp protease N-terminal domain-containing protein, partial [Paludibacter sp.]